MRYDVEDGRVIRYEYVSGLGGPSLARIDCGPAHKRTRFQRAVRAMERLERHGQTGRALYARAQRVATREL